MSTCNIILLTCNLFMSTRNIVMSTFKIIMLICHLNLFFACRGQMYATIDWRSFHYCKCNINCSKGTPFHYILMTIFVTPLQGSLTNSSMYCTPCKQLYQSRNGECDRGCGNNGQCYTFLLPTSGC